MVRMLTEIGIQSTKDMYELAIGVRANRIVKTMTHSLGMKGDLKMAKQQEAYGPQTLPGIDLTSLGFCYEVKSDAKVNYISWCCDIAKKIHIPCHVESEYLNPYSNFRRCWRN